MKVKRLLSFLTSIGVCLSTLSVVSYADLQQVTYDSRVNDSASSYNECAVDVERAELYTVTLPKTITMDGSTDSPEYIYNVAVKGEIASSHFVRVIPLDGSSLELSDGSEVIDLGVTQTKRRFAPDEILNDGTNTTGTMGVENLEPGLWVGKVRFYISLDDGCLWKPASCTAPKTLLGTDTNDNGVLDVGEEATDVITKGRALGHKIPDDCAEFPATCERCGLIVYSINTPAQLTAFRDSVNAGRTYSGTTITLGADIDMSGEEPWTKGIGEVSTGFAGKIDGKGHTIKNLVINGTYNESNRYCGFVGELIDGGVVCNLTLENPQFTYINDVEGSNYTAIGTVVGESSWSNNKITNVHVKNGFINVTNAQENTYVGGIAGETYSTTMCIVSNCSVTGHAISVASISGNKNVSVYAAGLVALNGISSSYSAVVKNCVCAATVSASHTCYYGNYGVSPTILGGESKTTLKNCIVNTETTSYKLYEGSSLTTTPAYILTNCLQGDTATLQKQAAVDILNTDNTGYIWELDLENTNGGYPVCKMAS